jgi:hypothetical protein
VLGGPLRPVQVCKHTGSYVSRFQHWPAGLLFAGSGS